MYPWLRQGKSQCPHSLGVILMLPRANALIIHYTENNHLLQDGELVLVDAGCEFKWVNLKFFYTFSLKQKLVVMLRISVSCFSPVGELNAHIGPCSTYLPRDRKVHYSSGGALFGHLGGPERAHQRLHRSCRLHFTRTASEILQSAERRADETWFQLQIQYAWR